MPKKGECVTCTAKTKKGARCSLKTCKTAPMCHHHTPLRLGNSKIPNGGKGLFARRDIPTKTKILDYTLGTDKLTHSQMQNRYPTDKPTHLAEVKTKDGVRYFDAKNPNKSWAGMANTSERKNGKKLPNNARFNGNGNGGIATSKKIKKDQEILLSYGTSYTI